MKVRVKQAISCLSISGIINIKFSSAQSHFIFSKKVLVNFKRKSKSQSRRKKKKRKSRIQSLH
ncbi:uncharacterized protein ASCRUDRAFT_115791 [Ascoidea rubescens DSM 1968]|uniref:Uncharacterized protein n=1 Tax=Ascoidea rubescens DSM 1968 TaxID=1344418 RepID=A0A1D2VBR4_9ASCO|nr:hypothetical protein ASCRUDRAFT_115791 [Ascoidea rubescens DSM 1968]ODV59051.1 hypothetical protein ASCRUDRAFT_115791 [Ascoidea rubescens DSM 1968]